MVNNTGGPVSRLRFRIVEKTTFPAPLGTADLRARTSSDTTVSNVSDVMTCAVEELSPTCTVTVRGTTLEEPPNQPHGGDLNSTLTVPTVMSAPATGRSAEGETVVTHLAPRGSRVKGPSPTRRS